ncbi:MAG TPA: sugar phosphate isomerase/epimerase family protein [Armatimonadota bacterium]|nr:sugar phosphate isomerase/epimerase family protein [Armatimonadota bacterium]
MKVAVFTDEVSQDLDTAIRLAVRHRLDGVEIRTVWDKPVQHLTAEEVGRVRRALGEHELSVAAIASPVFKCELDDEAANREHLDYLRSCIRIAKELDTEVIRVFTFWKRGPSQPIWGRIKRRFRPAVPLAEEAGVVLGVENEHTTYCATAAETKRFVTEIGSPAVRAVWDPANEIHAEEGIRPYPDGYEMVKPFVAHLHVKDAARDPSTGIARLTPVGEGDIDWKGQLRDLLSSHYEGYASLETHWRPKALPENSLSQPGGEGFSEAGEYASDLCLKNLMRILGEARREAG